MIKTSSTYNISFMLCSRAIRRLVFVHPQLYKYKHSVDKCGWVKTRWHCGTVVQQMKTSHQMFSSSGFAQAVPCCTWRRFTAMAPRCGCCGESRGKRPQGKLTSSGCSENAKISSIGCSWPQIFQFSCSRLVA